MLPPGPDRSPRVWELAALRRDPLRYFAELRRHGEVAHVAVRAAGVLLVRITLVQDPALIKKILVDDDACFEKPRALKKLKVLLGEGLLTSEGHATAERAADDRAPAPCALSNGECLGEPRATCR